MRPTFISHPLLPPAHRIPAIHGPQFPSTCPTKPTPPISFPTMSTPSPTQVTSSERAASLPWPSSIAGAEFNLLFMPFVTHQLDMMRTHLKDLHDLPFDQTLSYNSSTKRPARIESWQWQSSTFRKIRATYIDAGINAQVFNSVWYPSYDYELPLLGIDFLSFGKKKVLCVLDFQPLTQDAGYLARYCEPVAHIKTQYQGLSGSMSTKFYDETQFFSRQLVFAKFDNSEPVMTQLFPAFQQYLEAYVAMMKGATPDSSEQGRRRVAEWQREYDQYSAERDPAVGLFSTYWGEEWAERFTHEFLFSESVPVPKQKPQHASM